MDPEHPFHDPEDAKRYGSVILQAYQRVDRYLGELLDQLDEDTSLFVISDHGFGAKHLATTQLNRWLEAEGFLTYRRQGMLAALLGAVPGGGAHLPGTKERLARFLPFCGTWCSTSSASPGSTGSGRGVQRHALHHLINRKPEGPREPLRMRNRARSSRS
jgi:predicted AlkP superfamily phosphohydrolase/phosphomutase